MLMYTKQQQQQFYIFIKFNVYNSLKNTTRLA